MNRNAVLQDAAVPRPGARGRPKKRAEQQLAVNTRPAILNASFAECTPNNPGLKWVAKTAVTPLMDRLLPQIAALQKQGVLPQMEPILFHYMMVSLTAMLSEFGPEMRVTRKLVADDPDLAASYWLAVEKIIFGGASSESPGAARAIGP